MQTLSQIQAISLSELTGRITGVINRTFEGQSFWVIADLTNHTFYPNKDHHYFEVIEKGQTGITASMKAVAWRPGAARIRNFEIATQQKFKSGVRVCLKVQVDFHPTYGLKLVVVDVDPSFTLGQVELQRQATIDRLLKECASYIKKEGDQFITQNSRLSLGMVIQRIAVVSSSSSAGYQDFMHTLVNNKHGYRFKVNSYFTTVQGEVNAEAARQKIQEICASGICFDAVVIIRGGGSDTDFLLFDQFTLCDAVAKLHIPVITGIGHLKNMALVDLMAHTATNAPTKAAELIIAHNNGFETAVLNIQKRVVIKSQQILGHHQQEILLKNATLARKAKSILTKRWEEQEKVKVQVTAKTKALVYRQQIRLSELSGKISGKPEVCLTRQRANLQNEAANIKRLVNSLISNQERSIGYIESLCRMMSPVNILRKGFAIVYQGENIVTEGTKIEKGTAIKVRLLDSEFETTVNKKTDKYGDEFDI